MKLASVRVGLAVALTAATLGLAWLPAAAQESDPARPITMVMPYAPGGPGDTITRLKETL